MIIRISRPGEEGFGYGEEKQGGGLKKRTRKEVTFTFADPLRRRALKKERAGLASWFLKKT